MFRTYINLTIRHLLKRKFYSAVTILSLAISLTFTWLTASFTASELRVNDSLRHQASQYIIRSQWKKPGLGYEDVTLAPLAKTLKEQYPNLVADYYRFDVVTTAISTKSKHFSREAAEAGDPSLIQMYGFAMVYGNPKTALSHPNSVVITEANALKYFGKTDVLGEVLSLTNYEGGQQDFTVTGVLHNLPRNSVTYLGDLSVQVFIPFNSLRGRTEADSWHTFTVANYIELNPGVKPEDLTIPLQKIMVTQAPKEARDNLRPYLTSLKTYYRDFNKGVVIKTIYTLLAIALFLLLMAIVNFVTVAISNASSRIREIGVRKVLGSLKKQLIYQFLIESNTLAFLALLLSLVFYELFRSPFAELVGRSIPSLWTVTILGIVLGMLITLVVGLLAGSYPAFRLSALPTVDSLKGKLKSVNEGIFFRRGLLTTQFAIALLVFSVTLIVSQQVSYLFTKDLSSNDQSILLVSLPRDWTPKGVLQMETVRAELARLPEVDQISMSSSTLKGGTGYSINLYPVGTDSTQATPTFIIQADEHFVQTYQIPLLAGRFYASSQRVDQEDKLVLNETAIKALGYKNAFAAIGQQIYSQGYAKPLTIIGVTKDFTFHSLKDRIEPTAISHVNGAGNLFTYFSIKLRSRDVSQAIGSIEAQFHQLLPDAPFEFSFTDEALRELYQAELRLKKAAQTATMLAFVIVLCGVVGIVSLSIVRRSREVAVRKVLGASPQSLLLLFMQEFMLALGVGMVIAFPIAFLLIGNWLQSFAYHIDISLFSFMGVGLCFALLIGLIIGLQTWKTTLSNPVHSLRSE